MHQIPGKYHSEEDSREKLCARLKFQILVDKQTCFVKADEKVKLNVIRD